MIIYYCLGVYIALLHGKNGGGYVGRGRTHNEALSNCLAIAEADGALKF